jgi:hypothetical protein
MELGSYVLFLQEQIKDISVSIKVAFVFCLIFTPWLQCPNMAQGFCNAHTLRVSRFSMLLLKTYIYMALELFFVSARTNKRHHHHRRH